MADHAGADQTVTARSPDYASRLWALVRTIPAVFVLLGIAACGQVPSVKSAHSKVDPVWGVEAPKKMVADGEPVPPGGGRYQVGKPYMVGGRMYFPREQTNYDQVGLASWYGSDFHGRETANGEVYDKDSLSAAHTTLPIPSYARVTNLDNGRSILVRINDRGPYVGDRLIDVSERTAELLAFKSKGLSHVRVQYVGPAPVEGSDQRMLVASLRSPGTPASIGADRTLIARADKVPSDGRMTGLAAANLVAPDMSAHATPQPVKPIILAAATEREMAPPSLSPRPSGYGPQGALPTPAPRPQFAAIPPQHVAFAPTPTYAPQAQPSHAQLPPNTLGTLPARSLGVSAPRPGLTGTAATLAPLPADSDDAGPLPLSPSKTAAPGPGAIARLPVPPPPPVMPSRYGPAGQTVYKMQQSQGFAAETRASPAATAIDRLIAASVTSSGPHINLGSYARPENAARVADLMQPYGAIRTVTIRSGLGEQLTAIELEPASGMVAGDVISIADRLGIHAATLVE